jgi:hypothetical protein
VTDEELVSWRRAMAEAWTALGRLGHAGGAGHELAGMTYGARKAVRRRSADRAQARRRVVAGLRERKGRARLPDGTVLRLNADGDGFVEFAPGELHRRGEWGDARRRLWEALDAKDAGRFGVRPPTAPESADPSRPASLWAALCRGEVRHGL